MENLKLVYRYKYYPIMPKIHQLHYHDNSYKTHTFTDIIP
jgi:hypothetical protein